MVKGTVKFVECALTRKQRRRDGRKKRREEREELVGRTGERLVHRHMAKWRGDDIKCGMTSEQLRMYTWE